MMTEKTWEVLKVCRCEHTGDVVQFEAQVIYPADLLPDQPARIAAHRCSNGLACSLDDRPACVWAGTNPAVDPFVV
jgi:hypothetical protein